MSTRTTRSPTGHAHPATSPHACTRTSLFVQLEQQLNCDTLLCSAIDRVDGVVQVRSSAYETHERGHARRHAPSRQC
jgi:hypothetical protein